MKPGLRVLCALALAGLCALSKWDVRLGHFGSDDWVQVMEGRDYAERGLAALRVYYARVLAPNEYRPLPPLVSAVDYLRAEYDPAAWHETNWILHVLCSWLVLELGLAVSGAPPAAFAAAALFAVAPGTAHSAFHVSSRYNILSTIFLLGALLAGVRARERRAPALWALAAALSAASVLCKEAGFVIPLLAAALLARREPPREAARWAPPWAAAYALPVVLLAWVRVRVAGAIPAAFDAGYRDPRVWIALHEVGVETVRELFLPGAARALADAEARGAIPSLAGARAALDANNVAVCLGLAGVYLALTLLALRRSRLAFLGLLWIAVTTLPVVGQIKWIAARTGAVPSGEDVFSANRLYLSAAGASLVLAAALVAETSRARRIAAAAALAAVGAVFTLQSRAEVMRHAGVTWGAKHCRDAPAALAGGAPAGVFVVFDRVGLACQIPFVMRLLDDGLAPAGWAELREEGAVLRPPGLPSVALSGERRASDAEVLAAAAGSPALLARPTAACGSLCLEPLGALPPEFRARLGEKDCGGETIPVSKLDNWACDAARPAEP